MAEITLNADNFEDEVINSDKPVLVDFWASWCGPCRMLAPMIEEIAQEQEGVVKVGKVNVDEEPELALRYGIASIPTLMVFCDGAVKTASVGVQPKAMIEEMLK